MDINKFLIFIRRTLKISFLFLPLFCCRFSKTHVSNTSKAIQTRKFMK